MILPNCRELIEFLDDYVERRLALPKRLAFDAHLAVCPDCRHYLAGYRKTVELVKDAKVGDESAAPMPESLVQAILDSMKRGGGPEGG